MHWGIVARQGFLPTSLLSIVRLFWENRKAVNLIGKFLATLYNKLSRALFFVSLNREVSW
ncbi:hypothetical protein C7R94_12720 [Brevibacillus sp. NRRL NRS-603]|nr:hypothetical protein C7R94_12720 [Brevibacillus sp. NRRL NRS-603]